MTSDLPTIRLRPARRGDAGSILDWRNDAETRKLSGDTGEVSVERHQAWFGQMLADPGCWFGVAEDGSGQPFGVVRFNLDPDDPSTAEVSINLAPEYRGRGLGGQCLQSAIHQYRGENRAVSRSGRGSTRTTCPARECLSRRVLFMMSYLRADSWSVGFGRRRYFLKDRGCDEFQRSAHHRWQEPGAL